MHILVLGLLLALLPITGFSNDTLRVAVSTSWSAPLADFEKDQLKGGLVSDVYTAIGKAANLTVVPVVLPRKRIDGAVLAGDIDLRCYVNRKWTDIPDELIWSPSLFEIANVVVSGVGQPVVSAIENLPAKTKIGTVLGFRYPALEPYFASGQLLREDTLDEERVLLKLSAGRNSHGVVLELAFDWYRRTTPKHGLADRTLMIEKTPIHCAVPKRGRIPADQLLAVIDKVKKSGRIEAILASYR